ncbi:hypothetical protein [Filifactor alocis]|uniref:hypothetical protein n=1 Tax=Filifactor alocis TaxID=143361 RepID=UPI0028D31F66|nr:hypothetical protein [Filifactor alocis]
MDVYQSVLWHKFTKLFCTANRESKDEHGDVSVAVEVVANHFKIDRTAHFVGEIFLQRWHLRIFFGKKSIIFSELVIWISEVDDL